MLKVNDDKVLTRVAQLESDIANNDNNALVEAQRVASYLNYDEETTLELKAFILKKDARFNVVDKEKELAYLKDFCEEYEEPTDTTEDTETEQETI